MKHEWFDRSVLDEILENTKYFYPRGFPQSCLYNLDEQLTNLTTNPAVVFIMSAKHDEVFNNAHLTIKTFDARKFEGRWMFRER
tara:strand:- start:110 stop:361 length:252 start_codon:yes stop_codon:yes gene_type:complete